MAVRQYVGARYVPKFYQNSQNPLSCEWEGNKAYEALTIVTYNSSSYTSKIPVPVGIGNPAQNPTYWVNTANYNAQVEQYRKETADATTLANNVQSNLNTEIEDRTNADDSIMNGFPRLIGKQVAIYGDSWVDPSVVGTTWPDRVTAVTGKTVHVNGKSGMPLTKMMALMDDFVADIYIVHGMINDWLQNLPLKDMQTAIQNIIKKFTALNPSCEIYFVTAVSNMIIPSTAKTYKLPPDLYRSAIWTTIKKDFPENHNKVGVVDGLRIHINMGGQFHPVGGTALNSLANHIMSSIEKYGDTESHDVERVYETAASGLVYDVIMDNGKLSVIYRSSGKSINYTDGICNLDLSDILSAVNIGNLASSEYLTDNLKGSGIAVRITFNNTSKSIQIQLVGSTASGAGSILNSFKVDLQPNELIDWPVT